MRRASTCLALLGLAVLGLPAAASAAPTVTLKGGSRADPGLPGHRQHPRRGRRARSRIHDLGHRIRRLPVAADRASTSTCRPARSSTRRGSPRAHRPRLETTRAGAVPEEVARRPEGHRQRRREPRHRTRQRERCRCRRSSLRAAALSSSRTALRRSRSNCCPRAASSAPRRRSARTVTADVPLVETVPGALDGSAKEINVMVGAAYKKGKKTHLLRHAAEEVPEGRLPVEDHHGIRKRQQSQGTGRKGGSHLQGAVP